MAVSSPVLGSFVHCNLLSLECHFNKLLHQIELTGKIGNLVLYKEIFLPNLLNKVDCAQLCADKEVIAHFRILSHHIIKLYEQNGNNHLLLIQSIACKLKSVLANCEAIADLFVDEHDLDSFSLITNTDYSQLYLICSNQMLHSAVKCEEVFDLYRNLHRLNLSDKDKQYQNILIKLKNSLFQCSLYTSFVINIFSSRFNQLNFLEPGKLNLFDKIYVQALIHTLKNDNTLSMVEILLRCPDSVLLDDNLLCQITEYFLFRNKKLNANVHTSLLDLYSSCLYRSSPQLITSIYSTRLANPKYQSPFFNSESKVFFQLKECFLLALHEKKHFISQFHKVYCTSKSSIDISSLPVKSQIIIILISLYDLINSNQNDTSLFIERISRFESNVSNLLLEYECDNLDGEDNTFSRLVVKLRFVLNFASWCHTHLNHNNIERGNFYYSIIVSLLSGTSPLKILFNYGFLELKPKDGTFNAYKEEIVCDQICDMISQFDQDEAMVLKGFVVLRLIFCCILSKEDDSVYCDTNHMKNMIQNIKPIQFRVEIMENIFSLLFLNKSDFNHHLNLNSSEDEDYLDETLSSSRISPNLDEANKATKRRLMSDFARTTTFLCPNWIIPKILDILKDILYKTSADIYKVSHAPADSASSEQPQASNKTASLEECKFRINTLIKYVGDAHFRYDVIRPAFYKNIFSVRENSSKDENSSTAPFEDVSPFNRELISTNSSDTDQKSQSQLSTSLISCMLASHTQLLCYTLIENSLENAVKIARLFQEDLKNSKELKELQLLEYFSELHSKICNIHSNFSDHSTFSRLLSEESNKLKIGEIANLGIRTSKIQSLIYEMQLKMDKVDNVTKKIFMIDYALCSSPSLEISQAILESIFMPNSNLLYQNTVSGTVFPEKVELFIRNFQRLSSDLAHSINTSELSISDFLEKSLPFSLSLDAQCFVSTLHFETKLRKAYYDFYCHLNYLENRIIDEPDLLSADNGNVHLRKDSHLLLTLYDRIVDECPVGKFHYLKTLVLYVGKVSKALVECRRRNLQANKEGSSDSSLIYSASYFSILRQSPSAILCSMVIKSKISPKIIDDLALIMKVNLIAVLCSVYCPSIATCFLLDCDMHFFVNELCNPCLHDLLNLYSQGIDFSESKSIRSSLVNNFFAEEVDASFGESSFDQSFQPLINNEVLNYFNSKCSVLVELLQILNLVNDQQVANLSSVSSINMHIYEGSPLLNWVERIKGNFFFGDVTSTISLAFHPRIVSGHPAVIKTLEYCAANQNFMQIYNLFKYIDDTGMVQCDIKSSTDGTHYSYKALQNAIFSRLVFMQQNDRFIFQIVRDPKMKSDLVFKLLLNSDRYDETFMATRLIRLCVQSIRGDEAAFGIDTSIYRAKLERLLCEIEFYAAVGQLTGLKTWKLSKDNLESIDILTIIKSKKRYLLAIEWYKIKGLEKETCDLHIELLIHAYSELNDYISLRKLFHSFVDEMQSTDMISIVEKTLNLVENLELRSFLVDLLATHHRKSMNLALVDSYEQYKLGIELVKLLSEKIRADYLKLIAYPLLLVEQLLMNCEIDSLERIINQYKLIRADDLVEKYAQKSVYIEIYECRSLHGSELTLMSSSFNDSASIVTKGNSPFVIPDKIPSKDQWVSDASQTHCMICNLVRFSMINRRHHCRRCGRMVCQTCSSNTFLIPEVNQNAPVRVCNDCHTYLRRSTRKESTHSLYSNSSNLNRRTNWLLYPSEDVANEARRFEFLYESAPSVTLCLAILRLHSDKKRCCKFIVDKICAPLLESTDSRNVDSTLLIEMIRSLLISTRLSVEEDLNQDDSNRNEKLHEIEQLNLYLDRLDVIRMMINFNYGTREMIGYVLNNNIQKLQEKLLEMERFELAIDIAKKYGLDASSIWKTWAMICLKHFQFGDARRKFGRYFDQATRVSEAQLTLKNIIETLVRSNSANMQQVNIKEKCLQIMSGKYDFIRDNLATHSQLSGPGAANTSNLTSQNKSQHLKPRIFQEIVYYFKQYGSSDDLLRFYVDHLYWKDAVEYFISLNPDGSSMANNFVCDLFVPAQTKGSLSLLYAAIRQCDPQLSNMWSCLIATCRYLDKNEFFNSLYRVQTFMSDYLRAAITQINCFFISQSLEWTAQQENMDLNSYDLLYHRVNHLEKARDNCNMYLHNIEYVKLRTGCLHVEKKDVLKQIRLIEMQIEVLRRFRLKKVIYPFSCLSVGGEHVPGEPLRYLPLSSHLMRSLQAELSIKMTKSLFPPTLMEDDITRRSLITSLIILYFCDNLEEGFRYSLRIIQDYQLDAKLVYKMAAGFLLAHQLEKNTSLGQTVELLNQLLVYVRSSCVTDQLDSHHYGTDSDSLISAQFVSRMSISRSASLSPAPFSTPNSMAEQSEQVQQTMHRLCDDIVTCCIRTIKLVLDTAKHLPMEPSAGITRTRLSELSESLIKLLSDDNLRIEAYLHAGKLKLAYLLAVSLGQRANVIRVLDSARHSNDQHYVKICEMWLKKNASNL